MQKVSLQKPCAELVPSLSVRALPGPSVRWRPAHGLRLSKEVLLPGQRGLSVARAASARLAVVHEAHVALVPAGAGSRLSIHCRASTLLLREPQVQPRKFMKTQVSNSPSKRRAKSSALRRTAAPALLGGAGASYRSRRVALCAVAGARAVLVQPRPNPSIEGTCSSKLRLLPHAPHVKR